MPKSEQTVELTDEEADAIREKLAAHEERKAAAAAEEAKAKYKDVYALLNDTELRKLAGDARKLADGLSLATEDRNLYFALDNLSTAVDAVGLALNDRARAANVTFN